MAERVTRSFYNEIMAKRQQTGTSPELSSVQDTSIKEEIRPTSLFDKLYPHGRENVPAMPEELSPAQEFVKNRTLQRVKEARQVYDIANTLYTYKPVITHEVKTKTIRKQDGSEVSFDYISKTDNARKYAEGMIGTLSKKNDKDITRIRAQAKAAYQEASRYATPEDKARMKKVYQSLNGQLNYQEALSALEFAKEFKTNNREQAQEIRNFAKTDFLTEAENKKGAAKVMKWYKENRERLERLGYHPVLKKDEEQLSTQTSEATAIHEQAAIQLLQEAQILSTPRSLREKLRKSKLFKLGYAATFAGLTYAASGLVPWSNAQVINHKSSQGITEGDDKPAQHLTMNADQLEQLQGQTIFSRLPQQSPVVDTIVTVTPYAGDTDRVTATRRSTTTPFPTPSEVPTETASPVPTETLTPVPSEPTPTVLPEGLTIEEVERLNYFNMLSTAVREGRASIEIPNYKGKASAQHIDENGTFLMPIAAFHETYDASQPLPAGPETDTGMGMTNIGTIIPPGEEQITEYGDSLVACHNRANLRDSNPDKQKAWCSPEENFENGSRFNVLINNPDGSIQRIPYIIIMRDQIDVINNPRQFYEAFATRPELQDAIGYRMSFIWCQRSDNPAVNTNLLPREAALAIPVDVFVDILRENGEQNTLPLQ